MGRSDGDRARTARDGYTYLHLLIVAGVVVIAFGLEEALAHVGSDEPLGWFAAAALGGGVAWFLAATVWFARRVTGRRLRVRSAGVVVVAAAVPVLAGMDPLAALTLVALLLVAVLVAEHAPSGPHART